MSIKKLELPKLERLSKAKLLSKINEDLFRKRNDVKLLSDDVKMILDRHLEDREAVKVEKQDGGYSIVYPQQEMPFLDKQTLQQLVALPNFKGLRGSAIEFKNDYDLGSDT